MPGPPRVGRNWKTWRTVGRLYSFLCGIVLVQAGGRPLIFLGSYLLLRGVVSRPSVRKTLLRLELAAVSVYFALLLGELLTGGWLSIPSRNPMASLRGLFVEDATAEFRNAPNFNGVFDDGLVQAEIHTNSFGDRDDEPRPEADNESRFLLLGDSFAFGWGLTREETIERQLEQMSEGRVDAYNLGVIAYNAEKVLARFEAADWWRGTAVLYLFFNNDLVDTEVDSLVIRDGYLVNRANQAAVVHYTMEIPVTWARLHSFFGLRSLRDHLKVLRDRERALAVWPDQYSPATIAGAVSKTREMERLALRRCARFLVVILPTRGETRWRRYAQSTAAYFQGVQREGIEVLEVRDRLGPGDFFSTDGHFNARGARGVAAAILDELRRKALLPAQAETSSAIAESRLDRAPKPSRPDLGPR